MFCTSDDSDEWPGLEAGGQRPDAGSARRVHLDRIPLQLEGLHRIPETLQLECTERLKSVLGAPTGNGSRHISHQDLPALGPGAESRRSDHRIAEIVVSLTGGVSRADPDPQPDGVRRQAVVELNPLLHGHGAGEGTRGGLEHCHHAVAQVLHLGPAMGHDRLAKQGEVGPAELVADLDGHAGGQGGRSHHVGEEDRDICRRGHYTDPFPGREGYTTAQCPAGERRRSARSHRGRGPGGAVLAGADSSALARPRSG